MYATYSISLADFLLCSNVRLIISQKHVPMKGKNQIKLNHTIQRHPVQLFGAVTVQRGMVWILELSQWTLPHFEEATKDGLLSIAG